MGILGTLSVGHFDCHDWVVVVVAALLASSDWRAGRPLTIFQYKGQRLLFLQQRTLRPPCPQCPRTPGAGVQLSCPVRPARSQQASLALPLLLVRCWRCLM